MFFERYNKHIIEEFAIRTISKSFDLSYEMYVLPNETDNFNGISLDGSCALEVTLVTSSNNMAGYEYEKLYAYVKRNLRTKHIKLSKLTPEGNLLQWQGGPIGEIVTKIQKAISIKNEKAKNRLLQNKYRCVDLCVCIDDGGWFDDESFKNINLDFDSCIFQNIFFITSHLFFRYTKKTGFEQYPRIFQ